MFKASCFALAMLLFACSQMHNVQTRPVQTAIPTLSAIGDTGKFQLMISELHVNVETAGNVATTTFDMSFHNPLSRVLEGEFEFPLADGQNISSYALEINGKLREGVVVEKMQARAAFENTVRRNIDPGLVEKTKGNNFKTRIYPIPANGTKRVVIGIEQKMALVNGAYVYQLPLYAKELVKKFSLKAKVLHSTLQPDLSANELQGFSFEASGNNFEGNLKKENSSLGQVFSFSIPFDDPAEPIVLTETSNGQTYFCINNRIEITQRNRPQLHKLAIFWDISASAEKRNRQKEIEFIQNFIASLGTIDISIIPFNITQQKAENFHIENSNSNGLTARLKNYTTDGGTQLGCLHPREVDADEFLLFSDGLSTFGKKEFELPDKPVITVNSSPSADYSYLKYIAEQTQGKFIDLSALNLNDAIRILDLDPLKIIKTEVVEGQVQDLVATIDEVNATVSLSGILKNSSASIDLALGFSPEEIKLTRHFSFSKTDNNSYDNVKRMWATMKIDQLDRQPEKNREQITALGKEFSIVTQYTSLLVLDRVEDYVQYEITPPAELQKEYYALLKEKNELKKDDQTTAFEEALTEMENLKEWWNKKYDPKNKTKGEDEIISLQNRFANEIADSTVEMQAERMEVSNSADQSIAAPPPPRVETYKFTPPLIRTDNEVRRAGDGLALRFTPQDGRADTSMTTTTSPNQTSIELREWSSHAEYLRTLDKVAVSSQIEKYLELKKQYKYQPSFFVDVADFFFERNQKEQALLVLSNIAEMKLEDAELLRVMAFRLREMNEMDLAVETFKDILNMRGEEPQSYRDLALVYSEVGKYNEAVPLLYKLVIGTWDGRFHDVRSIALNELNAIVSSHPEVDISAIDKRFIYAMPVDVRIVIGWTSDNSDIDLWVTDPNKEKCFYSHNRTVLGGKMSQDVTQGYGPEEFCLRKAKKGNYRIEANLFGDTRQTLGGPITITADLFTDYGRPNQKRKSINFRVTTNKEVVEVGALKM